MRRMPLFIYLFILFGLFNDCQYTHHTTPKSKINELRTEKDVRRSGRGLITELFRLCQEGLEKAMKKVNQNSWRLGR